MEQKTLQVEGMSCQHCVKAVETGVGELNGVTAVQVKLEAGQVDVTYPCRVFQNILFYDFAIFFTTSSSSAIACSPFPLSMAPATQ